MRTSDPNLLAAQRERDAARDAYAEVSRRCRAEEQAAQNRLRKAHDAVRAAELKRNARHGR